MKRHLILDRDGVINYDSSEYIKKPEEWRPIPGSIEAIARLSQAGYDISIATNQSGIARGLYTLETLEAIHNKMRSLIKEAGGHLHAIAFCPHGPNEGCACRKPQIGLLKQLEQQGVQLSDTPFVGDSLRDLEAALAAGCRPILVLTGNGSKTLTKLHGPLRNVAVFDSLWAFTQQIVG